MLAAWTAVIIPEILPRLYRVAVYHGVLWAIRVVPGRSVSRINYMTAQNTYREPSPAKQAAPNPQGKGLVPVLQEWSALRPRQIVPKAGPRLLADYFTSLLVLSAECQLKPVPGQAYYLYLCRGEWQLSLIEPERWPGDEDRHCLGRCELHGDMTWSLAPGSEAGSNAALMAAVEAFYDQFQQRMKEAPTVRDQLPFHVDQLPFYRRMAANALATSIACSAKEPELLSMAGSDWLQQLPIQPGTLLGTSSAGAATGSDA